MYERRRNKQKPADTPQRISKNSKAHCQGKDVWEDFVDSFKLCKKDGVHLNEKGVEVFARRMNE